MAKRENEYPFRALNRRAIQRLLNLTAIDQSEIHKLVNESGVIWPEISLTSLWIGPSAILWLNVDTFPWAEICQKVVREIWVNDLTA